MGDRLPRVGDVVEFTLVNRRVRGECVKILTDEIVVEYAGLVGYRYRRWLPPEDVTVFRERDPDPCAGEGGL